MPESSTQAPRQTRSVHVPAVAVSSPSNAGGSRLNPLILGYAMGPAAFVIILVLQKFGWVADEPVALWIAIFLAVPITSYIADTLFRRHPTIGYLHLRVAVHSAGVVAVINAAGWGPVLSGAFVFVALENLAHDGSRTWRITMLWSMVGIGVGMLGIWLGAFPSFLSVTQAEALSVMGAFVLAFVIRMAGATVEKQENAEASMRASEDRFRSLVQHSSDTIMVMSSSGTITYASPSTMALFGVAPEDIVGRDAVSLAHPDDRERAWAELGARLLDDAVTDALEVRMAHADGSWRYAEVIVSDLRSQPSVAGFVANLRDITERKEAEELLAHQALHDPLTSLANRTLIHDRTEQMLVRSRRSHEPIAALFIDLDNFKEVNDTLGHETGDRLLQAVADRFRATVRDSDTVGRLGGDEFVILAEGVSIAAGPEILAERLLEVLREPFHLGERVGGSLLVTASIGIASGQRASADDLLRDADIALYRAKAMGKNGLASFEPEMQSAVLDRLGLKMDLMTALANREFHVLYQPLFDLASMKIYGVEALLRWTHPVRGLVGPNEFIPMLEETGHIVEVGGWVLRDACCQAAAWHRDGHPLTLSVNVSMRQLESDVLLADVRDALESSGLDPAALLLEITETALMSDADATVARLGALKALGVSIAIDDFGTGYASLGYLRQFPVDALKIDRSFIASMSDAPESGVLIQAMVALAHALGLGTIAEGIEDAPQLESLRAQGCQRGQGFLVSRPVAPDEIVALLGVAQPVSRSAA